MSEASKFVANRLRQLRKQANLSQEQTASLVGVTFKYYQRLESGMVPAVRLSTIEQIAQAYCVPILAELILRQTRDNGLFFLHTCNCRLL